MHCRDSNTAALHLCFRVAVHCDRKVQRFKLREQLRANKRSVTVENMSEKSIQETYAPTWPVSAAVRQRKGLHIGSFPRGDEVVALFEPETYQEAFPGMLSGGLSEPCSTATATGRRLMPDEKAGSDSPPCTVTADYAIKLLRPTPTDQPVELRARVVELKDGSSDRRRRVDRSRESDCHFHGTFVAVKPGHPPIIAGKWHRLQSVHLGTHAPACYMSHRLTARHRRAYQAQITD